MPGFFQKALEVAARVTDPVAAAVFAAVLACAAFWIAARRKDKRMVWVMDVLGVGVLGLGALPLLARTYQATYLNTHGVYAVTVLVEGANGDLLDGSEVVCAPGGEKKRIDGDVAPGSRPADGVFTAEVRVRSAFLEGKGELRLAGDYHPVLRVRLGPEAQAEVRGEVQGSDRRGLEGAWVSVVGHEAERVRTGPGGGFVLPAHAARGQMIKLHVEAAGYPVYEGLQQAGDEGISIQLAP
jgi:hypothetical protein